MSYYNHIFRICWLAFCQGKKHLQNSLFALPLSQQHSTIICHWYARTRSHDTPATLAPAHTPCLFSTDQLTVRPHMVKPRILLPFLSETLFQMMSGVPHHCNYLGLVWRHICFAQFTKNEPFLSLYVCAWLSHVIDFFGTSLICINVHKDLNLLWRFHCLPVLILLCVILDCLSLDECLVIIGSNKNNAFCLHALTLSYWYIVC